MLGLAPWAADLALGSGTVPALLTPAALGKVLWPILGGGVLAVLLGRWRDGLLPVPGSGIGAAILGPARQATLAVGGLFERADGGLRQWPAAGLSLLALAILFGTRMKAGR